MLDRMADMRAVAAEGWRYAAYPDADSFGALLRGMRPLFPPELLDGSGWDRLLTHAEQLPAASARAFGLDFLLNDPAPRSDFSCPAYPGETVTQHYIRSAPHAAPDSPTARVGRFLAEQGSDDSSVGGWTVRSGLTYDVQGSLEPGPNIYLYLLRGTDGDEGGEQGLARRHAAATLAGIAGWSADREEQRAVERAFDALPPGAPMIFAGAHPNRPRCIRLVAAGISPEDVPAFLRRLEWPGSLRTAEALLEEAAQYPARLGQVAFDVGAAGPTSSLGLEISLGEPPALATTVADDWRPFVAQLEENGRCIPEKGQAMLRWLGRERIFTAHGGCLIWKGLNHIKLKLKDEAVRTIAYPGVAVIGWGGPGEGERKEG